MHRLPSVIDGVSAMQSVLVSTYISNVYTSEPRRGGTGPTDGSIMEAPSRAVCR
jgi:hypothetical protein